MIENTYEKLRERMDLNPLGCPPAPEIIEILKLLFTEDEATIALGLGFFPLTTEEISHRTGIKKEFVKGHLEALADKGVVFARKKEDVWGYSMVNTFHLFENPYRKGIHDDLIRQLTPLWKIYLPIFGKNVGNKKTAFSRVIPINKKIETTSEVLPYEQVSELINKAKTVGIGHCSCRELEQNCDAPKETCMMFDNTCNYLIDRGFAKSITKKEALKRIKEFDEAGLVRLVNNTQDKLEFVCHCCSCCCGILSAYSKYGNIGAFSRSAFLPEWNMEECIGCGICADGKCPTLCIEIENGKPEVKIDNCIGCGICSSICPNDAIKLVRSLDIPNPPANLMEFGLDILQENGKLEAFIDVNTPKSK